MNKVRRNAIQEIIDLIESAVEDAENHLSDEEECRDNIPENLQGSERYETADEACNNLESAVESLNEALDYLKAAIE